MKRINHSRSIGVAAGFSSTENRWSLPRPGTVASEAVDKEEAGVFDCSNKQLQVFVEIRVLFRREHNVVHCLSWQRKLTDILNTEAQVHLTQMVVLDAPKSKGVDLVHTMQFS